MAIDNFVDKLFSNDPFENTDEYTSFDPDALEETDFDIAKKEETRKDDKSKKLTVSLDDLRSITKNTFEKLKNKII